MALQTAEKQKRSHQALIEDGRSSLFTATLPELIFAHCKKKNSLIASHNQVTQFSLSLQWVCVCVCVCVCAVGAQTKKQPKIESGSDTGWEQPWSLEVPWTRFTVMSGIFLMHTRAHYTTFSSTHIHTYCTTISYLFHPTQSQTHPTHTHYVHRLAIVQR